MEFENRGLNIADAGISARNPDIKKRVYDFFGATNRKQTRKQLTSDRSYKTIYKTGIFMRLYTVYDNANWDKFL